MYYFGPLNDTGHYAYREDGSKVDSHTWVAMCPWGFQVDGGIQPKGSQEEGVAAIVHKDGWTALTFWDRTIDTRPGSHSTYLAEGTFTFEQMVEMAKSKWARRWSIMKFEVRKP